ncbi:hypothetical protein Y886_12670 [Xanthomonas hyacinthi DSM 19077]|nr:hypothetical protein Y886_12670 [Xanthomonas hyacinthi DSM 19077]
MATPRQRIAHERELQDLTALIRANTPLIVIETPEEARIVALFRQALMQVWRALHRWSITEGLRRIDLDREDEPSGPPDASAVLQAIKQADQRGICLLLDVVPEKGAFLGKWVGRLRKKGRKKGPAEKGARKKGPGKKGPEKISTSTHFNRIFPPAPFSQSSRSVVTQRPL